MGAQHGRARVLRFKGFHQLHPQQPGGAELGDLHEEVHADVEEEAQARREVVNVEALAQRGADVFEPVGKRKRQFLDDGRAGFLDVIAGNGNGIELGHVLGRVFDDVGNDAHGGLGRIDISVADHELLENVVLDGAGKLLRGNALFLAGNDKARQHRQHGAVHGHRHAHLVERDAVEQDLHVLYGIDGDPGLADIADDAGVIRIETPVGG